MMPVARVMALFRHYGGRKALRVHRAPRALDVTASRTGRRVYLHVANTSRTRPVTTRLKADGMRIAGGRVHEIADDPMREVDGLEPDVFAPVDKRLPASSVWTFPAASVSAVVLRTEKAP
jgi:hypothetical protein